jgi:hypothetical protein
MAFSMVKEQITGILLHLLLLHTQVGSADRDTAHNIKFENLAGNLPLQLHNFAFVRERESEKAKAPKVQL